VAELEAAEAVHLSKWLDLSTFSARMQDFDSRRMPDGYYRMMRPAPVSRDVVVLSIMVLKTLPDGTKLALASTPPFYFGAVGNGTAGRDRKLQSMVFQAGDGVAMLFASRPDTVIQFVFLARGLHSAVDHFNGFAAVSLTPNPYQAQVGPLVVEWVGTRLSQAIAVRREGTSVPTHRLRPLIRTYFETWNPLGTVAPGMQQRPSAASR
jgi:hypothetical protein